MRTGVSGVVALVVMLGWIPEAVSGVGLASGVSNVRPGLPQPAPEAPVPDMPDVPPQNVPVMIAQANQAQASDATTTRVLGVCSPAPSNAYSGANGLAPLTSARAYFQMYEHQTVAGPATTTILQQPKHGILRLLTEADGDTFGEGRFVAADQLYVYLPEQGYEGKDSATVLVDFGGLKVKVKYYFQAISGVLGSYWDTLYCSKTGVYWKISSTLDANKITGSV